MLGVVMPDLIVRTGYSLGFGEYGTFVQPELITTAAAKCRSKGEDQELSAIGVGIFGSAPKTRQQARSIGAIPKGQAFSNRCRRSSAPSACLSKQRLARSWPSTAVKTGGGRDDFRDTSAALPVRHRGGS